MNREFIYDELGEFGFNQFHIWESDKWTLVDLEVDCDRATIENFKNNNNLIFQFWINDEKNKLCVASNFLGHKRQVNIPIEMLNKLKVTFVEPAKGEAKFDLSIDSEKYRGEIISGKINVKKIDNNWEIDDYNTKRKSLEKIIESLLKLTSGVITKRNEYINA